MKNICSKKRISIICCVLVFLVAVVLISVNCFKKEVLPDEEAGKRLEVEENEKEQNIPSDKMQEDEMLPDKNEVKQPSKDDATQSSQSEEGSSEEKYEEIFEEKSETDDNSEGSSDIDNEGTKEEGTEDILEDIEDTSAGYGPIS